MQRWYSIPNGNTKNQPWSSTFCRRHRTWSFHVLVLQRTANKCTKIYNARAQLLFCSLNLSNVLVAVVVVVCFRRTLEETKATYNFLDNTILPTERESITKLLGSKKAPSSDKIRNEMIKAGIQYLKSALCKLFNLILKSGFFPSSWCEGIITPIYKSGDKNDPSNYRGICISSCLGKLFTSVLNTRLKNHVLQQNIIHQAQIGFLPNLLMTFSL